MKKISLVVAMAENGMIGQDNRLLWHLPNDLKHFKSLTLGKPIIMGRKTFDSIGRPLPGRQNIIMTHQPIQVAGCDVAQSAAEALALTGEADEVMVIGGGEIYRLFMPLATVLYITQVHVTLPGEVSFPAYDVTQWQEVSREHHVKDDKHQYDYTFVTLKK